MKEVTFEPMRRNLTGRWLGTGFSKPMQNKENLEKNMSMKENRNIRTIKRYSEICGYYESLELQMPWSIIWILRSHLSRKEVAQTMLYFKRKNYLLYWMKRRRNKALVKWWVCWFRVQRTCVSLDSVTYKLNS